MEGSTVTTATATLRDVTEKFGVSVLEHLDHEASIPTVSKVACQGDVSILRVTTKAASTPIPAEGVPVVRGENGGNTHSLHGTAFFDAAPGRAGELTLGTLTVPEDSEAFLLHPEHGALEITEGTYRIGRQREFAGTWALVRD
jgi:hypothetical protein